LSVTVLTESEWVPERLRLPKGKDHFNILTDFAMFGAIIFETMAVASIFVFRRSQPGAERTYRCPGYPLVPALYVLIMALVLVNTFVEQTREALIGCGFIAVGAGIYGVMKSRQRRVTKQV